MLLPEEELDETALLRYAQQTATRWGAERFAAEFERRDNEERWLKIVQSGTFRSPETEEPQDPPGPSTLSGLVDAAVQERVVGLERSEFSLKRPKHLRHPSVPRPPDAEPESDRRRARRRKGERPTDDQRWMITQAEAARMSPAARRLYGLDDAPSRDGS